MPRKVLTSFDFSLPDIRSTVKVEEKEKGCRMVTAIREDAGVSVEIRNYDFDDSTIEVRVLGDSQGYYKALQLADRLTPLVLEYRDKELGSACREVIKQWRGL